MIFDKTSYNLEYFNKNDGSNKLWGWYVIRKSEALKVFYELYDKCQSCLMKCINPSQPSSQIEETSEGYQIKMECNLDYLAVGSSSISPKVLPSGSLKSAVQPTPGTAFFGTNIVPLFSFIFFRESSIEDTPIVLTGCEVSVFFSSPPSMPSSFFPVMIIQ